MNKKFGKLVRAIRDENPDISEEEATELVIEYLESNLPQLLSQVSLQAHKKRGKSRSDIHSLAKIYIKSKKLQDARSKKEVVDILTEIQEDDLNKGLTDEANTITSRITEIEEAAVPMTKALMFSDADMSKAISREKKEEEDKSRALRGLELLGEDSSD